MTCDELRPDYPAYALGILDDPERSEITEHLLRKCEVCTPGVASALGTVGSLSGAVKAAEPPKDLRRRVIGMVDRRQSRATWAVFAPWGITAILAVALLSVSLPGWRGDTDTARLQQALSILNDPATKDVSFGETQKPARGRVFVHATRGVVFLGANLPKIERGKTFELWVIPRTGNPIPAGTFAGRSDDTAVYVRPGPVESTASAFAVTVEPEGGSPLPTTKPFIVAGIS